MDKPKRPTEAQYRAEKISLALAVVTIIPCADCGWPVLHGYCCRTCGSTYPSRPVAPRG